MNKKIITVCGFGLLLTACLEYEENRDINAVSEDGKIISKDGSYTDSSKNSQGLTKDKPDGNDGAMLPPGSDSSGTGVPSPGDDLGAPPPTNALNPQCLKADATLRKKSQNLEIVLTHIFSAMNDRDSNFGCIENKSIPHRDSNKISGGDSGEYAILLVRESDDDDDKEYVKLNLSCNLKDKSPIENIIFYTVDSCGTYVENTAPFCIVRESFRKGSVADIEANVPLLSRTTMLMIDATTKTDVKRLSDFSDCRLVLTRQEDEASFPADPGD